MPVSAGTTDRHRCPRARPPGDGRAAAIGRHGGWQDGSTILLRYIRDVDRWKKNPIHGAGL
ncbi:hypothetical protein [Sphaerisporangium perillae]|uniref:hypothetical protein n=1 Tax=Sphaerisporangium perillae TaxID=2935860 RepID=UPI00200E3180|nr:hypothetical protein [Sphaerisporangium perillae]